MWTNVWTHARPIHDLKKLIDSDETALVYIYSPFCGHCIHGAPIYNAAVAGLKNAFYFNAMPGNAAENRTVQMAFENITGLKIKYFPMLIGISRDGRYIEYSGDINKGTLTNFKKALEKT